MSKLIVKSEDGKCIIFPEKLRKYSPFINDAINDCPFDDGEMSIPLETIKSNPLEKIKTWIEYKENFAINYDLPVWEDNFFSLGQAELLEILLAADYLSMSELVNVITKKVASMIRGRTPAEIRDILQIENDFTKEEEEQIRKENEWIEEKI